MVTTTRSSDGTISTTDEDGSRYEKRASTHDSIPVRTDDGRPDAPVHRRPSDDRSRSPQRPYPTAREIDFTDTERRNIVRKIDIRLLVVFCLMYISIQSDRANLSNALTDNFLGDLNLTSADFNNALTINRITFMLAELPVQCIIVRYSFRKVFPWMLMAWGVTSAFQGFITTRAALYGTRALIGILEGGFMPGVAYLFTQFYTTAELTPRLAVLASCQDLAMVIASLTAAGLLRMRGVGNKPGWFWLFVVEGIWVFITGVMAWLYLPTSPYETVSTLCKKPWFSARELAILDYRLVQDDASKRHTGKKTRASLRVLWSTFRDWHLWGLFLLGTLAVLLNLPMKAYLGLTLRRMGFSVLMSNALGAPAALLSSTAILVLSLSSEYFGERTWHCVFAASWNLPCYIALVVMTPRDGNVQANAWARYTLATLIAGSPSMYPILLAWTSSLSRTKETRATNIASVSTLALLGAVASTQLYAQWDEPFYKTGNKAEIALCGLTSVVLVIQRMMFARLNRINAMRENGVDVETRTTSTGGQAVELHDSVRVRSFEDCDAGTDDHIKRQAQGYRVPL